MCAVGPKHCRSSARVRAIKVVLLLCMKLKNFFLQMQVCCSRPACGAQFYCCWRIWQEGLFHRPSLQGSHWHQTLAPATGAVYCSRWQLHYLREWGQDILCVWSTSRICVQKCSGTYVFLNDVDIFHPTIQQSWHASLLKQPIPRGFLHEFSFLFFLT